MLAKFSRLGPVMRRRLAELWPPGPLHRRVAWLLFAILLSEAAYLFVASMGRWTQFPFMEGRIDELAESFRAGHLHLLREPNPELLRRVNPFDPANASLWYWDASLYGGHFYYYWGPVPALLLAAVKIALRISRPLGDYVPVIGLFTLQLVIGALLIERLARRLFPALSAAWTAAAVMVFALANPNPFTLARPAIYEAAIVGGEAFVLLGVLLAFDTIWWSTERRRRSRLLAVCAGLSFGLALGCRVSLGPGLVASCLVAAAAAARRAPDHRPRRLLEMLLAFGVPLAALGFLLLAYNRLRFDHWMEFGQRFQLTWIGWKWSPAFMPANVYSYALRTGTLSCRFPFLRAITDMGAAAFPRGFRQAPGYFIYEPLIGQLLAVPWIWLCPAAFVNGGALTGTDGPPLARARRAMAVLLLTAGTLTFVPALFAPSATMRYMGDFSPVLVVLACLGAWNLHRLAADHRGARVAVWVALVVLGVATVAIGFDLGLTGYYDTFNATNPALFGRLGRALSICRTAR